jgi:hypothetical protein
MCEEGLCVKPDWDKAAGLYMRAQEAGQRFATERLIAGYARPGRDNGTALWWAARSPLRNDLPPSCIAQADPVGDPDGFNAGLERMPPATFQGCVYLVGVVNEIASQVKYPRIALHNNVTGTFQMEFVPAAGRVTWNIIDLDVNEDGPHGFRDLAREAFTDPREIRNSLVNYLKGKSNFALARYPHPDGGAFPADYAYKMQFWFDID